MESTSNGTESRYTQGSACHTSGNIGHCLDVHRLSIADCRLNAGKVLGLVILGKQLELGYSVQIWYIESDGGDYAGVFGRDLLATLCSEASGRYCAC